MVFVDFNKAYIYNIIIIAVRGFVSSIEVIMFFLRIYLKKAKTEIDYNNLPQHIAIIMDGNGRWAKRSLPRSLGHMEGAKALKRISTFCGDRHKIPDCLCFFN